MNITSKAITKIVSAAAACQFVFCGGIAQAAVLQGHVEEATLGAQVQQQLPESFPNAYQGNWHCVTTVIDSAVPTVAPGVVTQCDIEFKRNVDGRLTAHWMQQGWTESQSSVTCFSATAARLDRTSYYWGETTTGAWAARSRDDFEMLPNNTIIAKSYVDQYIDGQYVGRYRTNSILQKTSGPATTAMLPSR